ncbi:gliotoxin/aspirochlorine biosynthesis gamma-glutamylcyclotransferase [Microdochium nivale]|nr:gliotoxin/aspirochlorine biosynthesis gamma-glutamylcyclotransferase [Microdochium nivale]
MGVLSRLFADRKTGKVPHWLGVMTTVLFNAMWMSYDGVFKKWFGDGERTQVVEGGDGDGAAAGQQKWNVWSGYGRRRRSSFVLPGQGLGAARDEEKDRLLADW